MNSTYNIIASTDEYTVVTEYTSTTKRSEAYQTEAALEGEFIKQIQSQGYDYINIDNEDALISNLRIQLEKLNDYHFSDGEWKRFFNEILASSNDGIVEKTRKIQQDHVQILRKDDGLSKNIYLIDKKNIHNNSLQVINQYTAEDGRYKNRYDVTILVNGLPLVHVELKRRGVEIREAFNQIERYQRDSFWSGCGLFQYVQIFVISNGTNTKYYSNTTRISHISELNESGKMRSKKTSNSFEFTSYWADGKNKPIRDLVDFTRTFFAKHTILNILTKFCVFTSDNLLLVMRPYQIVATERILQRIEIANNYKKMGTVEAGGYIWHTTGSGKTLTSFKTAQLATNLPYIDKVLFVVDRNDLDYQTMKEYDKFEKGAANSNASTKILQKQLSDPNARIIITTIQKLGVFIKKNSEHEIYNKHVVLIFDECHRSQFGELHTAITKAFRNYHMFGFTGTPIFAANVSSTKNPKLRTTQDAFGDRLHSYTIVNAINDGNVLPFLIDYISTIKAADDISDSEVIGIDTEKIMSAPERISMVTSYILEHFDQKTKRSSTYKYKGRNVNGFNSIFAVSSIPMAISYYKEFKKQIEITGKDLKIATIYTFSPNGEEIDGTIFEGEMNVDKLDSSQRDFLERAIKDYNNIFRTNFDTSSDSFENYYKDISERMKNRELDLLIVVNMFLTGFDATTLNTLWVDKNLRYHGLIQAFSRTNRILNSVKSFGNIICFRKLRKATNDAIALFGDENATGTVLLKTYEEYYNGYIDDNGVKVVGYKDIVERLLREFPLGEEIIGEEDAKNFIKLFGSFLRLTNILSAFDTFEGNEILSERELQDYRSIYLDMYRDIKLVRKGNKENITPDIIFEIELVKQTEINIDYILTMVKKYHDSNCKDKEILVDVERAIGSSTELRSKKDLILMFIARVDESTDIDRDWIKFVKEQKETDLKKLIEENKLKPDETRKFLDNAFRDGVIKTTGTDIDKILPPMSRFGGGNREQQKNSIIEKLKEFYEKYFGLID
ncbi:type I restriction endonuclease subunit R [Candidatus Methanarcanum hacksteinii]|uniref:type I restriction endonuclease subunit R n=1 Tax=Candidatus Methanarcanum hacksteinii TaxID=2911857 RepID=UPI0037DC127E